MRRSTKHFSMTKQLLPITVILLLTLFSSAAMAKEIVHFTQTNHGDKWREHLENMAELFYEETGIKVNVIPAAGNQAEQVLVMIAGGVAPDVTDFPPAEGAPLITQGLFEDLWPYVERSGMDLSQIPPVGIEGSTSPDGKLWGLPISIYPVITFFNKDMFERAGLVDPASMPVSEWTWETFRESARRLTIDRTGTGQSNQYGTDRRLRGRWDQYVHQAGGQWYDRLMFPTESHFNTPEVLEAVRFVTTVMNDDGSAPPHGSSGYSVWPGRGANVAMTLNDGPGAIGTQWQNSPVAWDVAALPKGPVNRAVAVVPNNLEILKDSTEKEAAWQWVHYLIADVDHQVAFATTTGRLPAIRDAMLRYGEIPIDMPPNWMAIIDAAFDPDGFPQYVVPSEVRTPVNAIIGRVWSGELPPEIGLEQIHDVVSGILAQQK